MLAMAVGSKERPAEDSSRGDIKQVYARLDFATEAGQKGFGCRSTSLPHTHPEHGLYTG